MQVTVYSTPTCPYCIRAKEFFNNIGIRFTDVDVSFNKEKMKELIARTGQVGVPVIEIEGEIILGFDEKRIREAVSRHMGQV